MPDKAFRSRRTEFRAADPAEGQPMTLSGYFVVFGQPYYIDDWCEEVVDRHAFDDADMTDVRALIDHDPRLCLGRHNDNVETLEFSIDDGWILTQQLFRKALKTRTNPALMKCWLLRKRQSGNMPPRRQPMSRPQGIL